MDDGVKQRKAQDDEAKKKLRKYLESLEEECEYNIQKLKRKNKIVKIIYTTLLISSIVGQTVVLISAPFLVPVVVIASISGTSAVATAIMGQFKLRDRKSKLCDEINRLNLVKSKIRYTEALNGDLTGDKIKEIYDLFQL